MGCLSRGLGGTCSKQLRKLNFVVPFRRKVSKTMFYFRFEDSCLKTWFFETFLLIGSTKLRLLNCFELVPSRPLDRHPTSHQLKHFQISHFQGESKFFISPEGNPKLPNGCDFLAKTSPNWSYQNVLGDIEVFIMYTPP